MIPLLAQVTADQIHPLVQFIIGGSAAVFLLNQAITFWKEHMREKPVPGETYATKEEMRQAHGRMNRERDEANGKIAAAEAIARAAAVKVETEVKAVERAFVEAVAQIRRDGEARVTGVQQAIDGWRKEMADEHKDDTDKLHERITELLSAFSELKGEFHATKS
ncbi:MAG TPA: hypothetical protein VK985_09515 [Rariglobus sp.]|nr:hypothetical protein [Rariglobus sp.]